MRKRLDAANTKPQLEALHDEFKRFRYVDPACGCGNFLIVAYREMRNLELDLLIKLRTKQGDTQMILDPSDLLNVTLDQFTGMEIKWWPAKIAETAMFLVDHQSNRQMEKTLGVTPNRLPIDIAANIHHANALTHDWLNSSPMAQRCGCSETRPFSAGRRRAMSRRPSCRRPGRSPLPTWTT